MRIRPGRSSLLFGMPWVLTACAVGTAAQREVPAVVSQPTEESRAELQHVVNSALGADVTLSQDALTQSSTLSVERRPIRDASGRRIEVRESRGPELFRLVKRGERCVIIFERTQAEYVLNSTKCTAR